MDNQEKMDTTEPKDPLALDAITERRLVAAILDFLKTKTEKGNVSSSAKEGLEAARRGLTQAFELTDERIEILKPSVSLLDIFGTHPDATPANPKQVLEAELKNTPAASAENKSRADDFKNKGNDFMKNNQVDEALSAYGEAINLDPTNPILYCNRAAAYSKKNQHDLAAKDCEIALAFDPNYAKAYGRYGLALHGLGLLKEAKEALEKAVSLDPENQLYKNNLKLVEDTISSVNAEQGGAGGLPGGFPGLGGLGGGAMPDAMMGMLGNQDFQQAMMQMMSNPQVQNLVGQFSSMFMNQMGGAPGQGPAAAGGAATAGTPPTGMPPGGMPPGGMPPGMPNLDEMLRNSMGAFGGMTPEQLAEQMRGLFGGAMPPGAPGGTQPPRRNPGDDKENQGGSGGPPSYFS